MNTNVLKPVLMIVGASLLLSGCVVRERTVYRSGPAPAPAPDAAPVAESSTEVEVGGPPPADLVEVQPVMPGPDFVWVGGFWAWGPGGWVWRHGYWGHPPYRGARWYGPHYVFRGGRHIWVRGGWRR